MVAEEQRLVPFRVPKVFTTLNLALTPYNFSVQELVEILLFVVTNIKVPVRERGEALEFFS